MALTHRPVSEPAGAFTTLDGEDCYRISGYDRMPAFLMSIPSASDLWMFLASSGSLTAGRVSPDGSLFPYETVDRLADAHHHTGPITLVRLPRGDGKDLLWQPFSERSDEGFRIERNLYKNTIGNRVHFEEINHDLGLAFRYRWSASDEFGLVRSATLSNLGPARVPLSLLDGLRNLLPTGAPGAGAAGPYARPARALPAIELPRRRVQARRLRSPDAAGDLLPDREDPRSRRGRRGTARQHRLVPRPE